MKTGDLAEALGVEPRRLEYWLSADEQRWPDLAYAERLAELLGVGLEEICSVIPEDERLLAAGGRDGLRIMLRLLSLDPGGDGFPPKDIRLHMLAFRRLVLAARAHWERFASYAAYVSFRHWPLRGYARRYSHHGTPAHEYLEFCVTPISTGTNGTDAKFIVGYALGPLRIDYGFVRIADQRVMLEAHFSNHRDQARRRSDGSFRLRTWVGPDPADFIVHGDTDFFIEARYTSRRDLWSVKDEEEEDVVGFLPSPHDRVASGSS
jgi:hypothetical protein